MAEVVNKSIVDWQRYSGRLEAIDRVDIRPLVSGTLTAVHFRDGTIVKKGDVSSPSTAPLTRPRWTAPPPP